MEESTSLCAFDASQVINSPRSFYPAFAFPIEQSTSLYASDANQGINSPRSFYPAFAFPMEQSTSLCASDASQVINSLAHSTLPLYSRWSSPRVFVPPMPVR
ncbi:hypothetical protein BHM03_00019000 [Ensete ventricosum]|nr:hypothetical protein BHM03_00019000 [Ensete ventricosum]